MENLQWIDERTVRLPEVVADALDRCSWRAQYQETFALCQALPGPGSTKMLYAINVIRGGYIAGVLSFLLWRLATLILQSSADVHA